MSESRALSDLDIQDFVDGRLDQLRHARVTQRLAADPAAAAAAAALREQNELLRGLGREILDEPVPERLRQALRRPAPVAPAPDRPSLRQRLLDFFGCHAVAFQAVAAVLLLCVGGLAGWQANERLRPRPTVEDVILAALSDAYIMDRESYPLSFPPDRSADFNGLIKRAFEREIPLPDLASIGYSYRGGRIVPTAGRRVGYLEFEGPENARIAVIFWPSTSPPPPLLTRPSDKVASRFWLGPGLAFGVLGAAGSLDIDRTADAVFDFYEHALTSS
jgi:anti-sigma factor RsiW